MTMRLYAERKGITAERFSVRLSHRRIHAEDCADCETKEGNIGEITLDIMIEGDVSEAARARLMEIADRGARSIKRSPTRSRSVHGSCPSERWSRVHTPSVLIQCCRTKK
jgi:uncharacterized OsmC-like protein